jgi:hypothetical protein
VPAIQGQEAASRLDWIHEIKHYGYRLMAPSRSGRRQACSHLPARSCLIDGEVVACDENGLAIFDRLRHGQRRSYAMLVAFDLLELRTTMPWAGGPLVRVKSPFAAHCIKTCVRLRPRPALS